MAVTDGINTLITKDKTYNRDAIGWSRYPYTSSTISNHYFRKKRWNHYLWIDKRFILVFAIIDLGYIGKVFIEFHDIEKNETIKKSKTVPFGNRIYIDDEIGKNIYFIRKNISFAVERIENHLHVSIRWDHIKADAVIYLEEESLNVLVPFNKQKFHYTSKQMALEGKGKVLIGEDLYDLRESLVYIDYGRGIWPYEKQWYWLTTGFEDHEKKIGLNLGGEWTDDTGVNENAVMINEKLYKLQSDVVFSCEDPLESWLITSTDSNEVDLVFTPIRIEEEHSYFVIVQSNLKQYIGYINGKIIVEGETHYFHDVLAWCEDHTARW